jgi:hypothetical protein
LRHQTHPKVAKKLDLLDFTLSFLVNFGKGQMALRALSGLPGGFLALAKNGKHQRPAWIKAEHWQIGCFKRLLSVVR